MFVIECPYFYAVVCISQRDVPRKEITKRLLTQKCSNCYIVSEAERIDNEIFCNFL
jgi:hypothetical protein